VRLLSGRNWVGAAKRGPLGSPPAFLCARTFNAAVRRLELVKELMAAAAFPTPQPRTQRAMVGGQQGVVQGRCRLA